MLRSSPKQLWEKSYWTASRLVDCVGIKEDLNIGNGIKI